MNRLNKRLFFLDYICAGIQLVSKNLKKIQKNVSFPFQKKPSILIGCKKMFLKKSKCRKSV